VIDAVIGGLLFTCGIIFAYFYYFDSHVFSGILPLLPLPPWWKWMTPVALGFAAAFAAIGVFFRQSAAGIIGSFSMLALAVWSWPGLMEGNVKYGDASVFLPRLFVTVVPMLVTGILVFWRFVMPSLHRMHRNSHDLTKR